MHSPQAVALRAAIMLGSLVGLPMMAVLGPSFPGLDGLWKAVRHWPASAEAAMARIRLPRDGEKGLSEVLLSLPNEVLHYRPGVQSLALSISSQPGGDPEISVESDPLWNRLDRAAWASLEVGGESPSAAGSIYASARANYQRRPADSSASHDGTINPSQQQQLQAMERRLRELGAKHYVLQPWGAHDELYRFQGRVKIEEAMDWCRHFEAVDADPVRAMQRVLDQVEAWRRGAS